MLKTRFQYTFSFLVCIALTANTVNATEAETNATNTEIHAAVMGNDLSKVKTLLQKQPEIKNTKDENGFTPLYLSAILNKKEIADFLLTQNVEVDIFSACYMGLSEKVSSLLKTNPNLANSKDFFGRTPLHYAVNKKTAEILIHNKARINEKDSNGWIPIYNAAFKKQMDVVRLLISEGAHEDIFVYCLLGKNDKVKELLAKDAEVVDSQLDDGSRPLHIISDRSLAELLIAKGAEINVHNKNGLTPLHNAIVSQNKDVVQFLILKGAYVNAEDNVGWTPLHWVAENGDTALAKILIKNGANINACANRNDIGQTPLHKAAQKGHCDLAELLIDSSAVVDIKNSMDETPLFYAKNKEVAELLIAKGADVNHVSSNSGWTPLHEASNEDVAKILVSKGANINARDKMGRTPLDMAFEKQKTDVIRFLTSKGAKKFGGCY